MTKSAGADYLGITSTIPVEVVFAAGCRPVDLNNRFITSADPRRAIHEAEAAGFPLNFCAWIKGIHSTALALGIKRIIGVHEGDCSNTQLLLEILQEDGVEVIPFQYPLDRDAGRLREAIEGLARRLGTTVAAAEGVREAMRGLRANLERLDEMTWREGKVTGLENHLWLINSSDMRGDWRTYGEELDVFLAEAEKRPPMERRFRLGFVGIPPIVDDLYETIEARGAGVVFNEFQRQFAMPGRHNSLVEQYLAYTYPYSTAGRIADITREASVRTLDGIIHYVQSFCFRQLQDRAIRRAMTGATGAGATGAAGRPVLTLEFDRPGNLDGRSLTRIEAFMEVLEGRRERGRSGGGIASAGGGL